MELHHEPAVLILSRQSLPVFDRSKCAPAAGVRRGGYVLAEAKGGAPELLLMASGSEVALCLDAYEQLAAEGVRARVVSLPSWEIFERQDEAYRRSVIPPEVKARVAVEQASSLGWERYVGSEGAIIGMETFGTSAPLKDVLTKFGFTPDRVVAVARQQLERADGR